MNHTVYYFNYKSGRPYVQKAGKAPQKCTGCGQVANLDSDQWLCKPHLAERQRLIAGHKIISQIKQEASQ